MTRFRPYLIGAGLGALALAILPLTGVLPHRAGGTDPLGWYHWLATRQSVTLRSLAVTPPDLSDPAMARRGAGHYALVCAACHGSPAAPPDRLALDLSPPPPRLAEGHWRPAARLFQSIRDGHGNSAMPAWPARARADEVWDMVAFLRALPDLAAADYRAMAGNGACTDCHGEGGEGRDGMPRLDILSPARIAAALRDYRAGVRPSGTMMTVARAMSDADILAAADRFGGGAAPPLPADDGSPGAALALRGDPARDIPACLSCHHGGDPTLYPAIAGQEAEFLRRQLHLFIPEEPGQAPARSDAPPMALAARNLTQADVAALVAWLARR